MQSEGRWLRGEGLVVKYGYKGSDAGIEARRDTTGFLDTWAESGWRRERFVRLYYGRDALTHECRRQLHRVPKRWPSYRTLALLPRMHTRGQHLVSGPYSVQGRCSLSSKCGHEKRERDELNSVKKKANLWQE